MELRQLRYFKALAEGESLTRVANSLYITPPALSTTISRLEEELNTRLFDRGKTMVLNENGQAFLSYVSNALESLDRGCHFLKEKDDICQTQLSAGVASDAIWFDMFLEFMERFPNINLSQRVIDLRTFRSDDLLNKYDIILAAPGDISTEKLHSIILYSDDAPMIMASKKHPIFSVHRIMLQDLREAGFIALPKGTSSRRYFDELFDVAGFRPNIVAECSVQMRKMLIKQGRGIGIATSHTSRLNTDPDISFIEITSPVYRRSQAIFWHDKRYQNSAFKLFRKFATERFQNGVSGLAR